jgi:hypothetical protein
VKRGLGHARFTRWYTETALEVVAAWGQTLTRLALCLHATGGMYESQKPFLAKIVRRLASAQA